MRITHRVSRIAFPCRLPLPGSRARTRYTYAPIYSHAPLKFQLPQRFSRILNRLSSSPVTVALLQRVAYTLAGGDMLRSDPR